MREMKDSGVPWIGYIPEDWLVRPVKSAFDKKNEKAQQENPTILSLARAGVRVRDITNNEGQLAESYYNYNPVSYGDLLINPMDLYSGANCNMSEIEGVISPAYVNLRARNGYDPKFYDFYFKTQYWSMAFFAHGFGVSYENRWTLNNETLRNYKIPVPTFEEQVKLRKYLDLKLAFIENIIEKTKESIEEYKKYKQSLITETVTKGLNPDVKMKDSGIEWIGEIPEHWEVRKLGSVSSVQTGPFGSQLHNEDYVESGTPIITVEHFGDMEIIHKNMPLVSDVDVERLSKYTMNKGDLIFSRVGSVDRCVMVSENEDGWLFSGRCLRVRLVNSIFSEYINYCFCKKSFKEYMNNVAVGSTMPSINTTILRVVRVPLPPYDEQILIVKWIKKKSIEINNFVFQKYNLIAELESYKKSLIYEVVTGKKKINLKEEMNLGL